MSNKRNLQDTERLLTSVELELMTIIWGAEKASVKDVVSQLPKGRDLAYTTVATVMKDQKSVNEKGEETVLKAKGRHDPCVLPRALPIVESMAALVIADSYAHIFSPLVSKKEYENTCLDHMVTHVFDGEPVALVQRLVEAKKLSPAVIEEILSSLANLKRKKT